MSDKHKPNIQAERRNKDQEPPTERRMPEVEEISISEFKHLMAANHPPESNTDENPSFDLGELRKP